MSGSETTLGQWVAENVLGQLAQGDIEPKDQQAAMWAAANQDDFDMARADRDGYEICSPSVPPDRKGKSPLARAFCK